MKGSSILRLVFPSGLLALALLFVCSQSTSTQNKQQSLKLAHIIFQGLVSVPQDVALKTAGLNPGDTITLDSIDVAAQRLVDSGLFSKLSYHVKSTGKTNQDATLTFVVSEQNIAIPVVFDNFVWFSEQELFNAVKAEVPSFNGLAPEAGRAT